MDSGGSTGCSPLRLGQHLGRGRSICELRLQLDSPSGPTAEELTTVAACQGSGGAGLATGEAGAGVPALPVTLHSLELPWEEE